MGHASASSGTPFTDTKNPSHGDCGRGYAPPRSDFMAWLNCKSRLKMLQSSLPSSYRQLPFPLGFTANTTSSLIVLHQSLSCKSEQSPRIDHQARALALSGMPALQYSCTRNHRSELVYRSWLDILALPTQEVPREGPSIQGSWSKEEIFGLLGVLCVLLAMCRSSVQVLACKTPRRNETSSVCTRQVALH
jgi:hypothetical protein